MTESWSKRVQAVLENKGAQINFQAPYNYTNSLSALYTVFIFMFDHVLINHSIPLFLIFLEINDEMRVGSRLTQLYILARHLNTHTTCPSVLPPA